jgi:hypothetical protein
MMPQSSDLSGAWTPVKMHWAPSDEFGMVAEAQVLYFAADGSFAIINGTISQRKPEKVEVAADLPERDRFAGTREDIGRMLLWEG